jgi:hypothetical protein
MALEAQPFPANLSAGEGLAGESSHWLRERRTLHGITLELSTDHAGLLELAAHLLRFVPTPSVETASDIRLHITTHRRWSLPAEARALPPSSNEVIDVQAAYGLACTFARLGALNFYELAPMAGAAYNLAEGRALAYVTDPDSHRPWLIAHLFLQSLMLEMLRGRGLYWIHAASVADQGRGVLVVGQTGAGKTTTCLKLVDGGFQFLAEDRTFLRRTESDIELLSFVDDIAVTARTLDLLPWLREEAKLKASDRRKVELDPCKLFPQSIGQRASPGLVLFPRVTADEPCAARPIHSAVALQRILPNSLLVSQPDVSQAHFDALAGLAGGSRCYELTLGQGFGGLPDLVRGLF